MCIGLILHTEQAYLRNVEMLDFVNILRIDALDGHINIRLTGE